MTTAQMARYLEQVASYRVDNGMRFRVTIVDVRMAWGKVQFQIIPISGEPDTAWVSEDSLTDIRDKS